MGYHTDFYGEFELDRPLEPHHREYLTAFSESRRMTRNADQTASYPDPLREAVGLPIGDHACYYVGDEGSDFMKERPKSIIDYNAPPNGQPGLWCNWVPSDDGSSIVWNEAEKFYYYAEWLEYIVEHFLKPWGYVLNGEVQWQGEEHDDAGAIVVLDNRVGVRNTIASDSGITWADGGETPSRREELVAELEAKLHGLQGNITSIDAAMRNEAVGAEIAKMAWDCADRDVKIAVELVAELKTTIA